MCGPSNGLGSHVWPNNWSPTTFGSQNPLYALLLSPTIWIFNINKRQLANKNKQRPRRNTSEKSYLPSVCKLTWGAGAFPSLFFFACLSVCLSVRNEIVKLLAGILLAFVLKIAEWKTLAICVRPKSCLSFRHCSSTLTATFAMTNCWLAGANNPQSLKCSLNFIYKYKQLFRRLLTIAVHTGLL